MDPQRTEAKRKWAKYLKQITQQSQFKRRWQNKDPPAQYKITTMQRHHINEILTILCYSFSCLGGSNNHKILMTTPNDTYNRFKCEIEHSIKTGLNIVILDEDNHVIAFGYGFDYCDQPIYDIKGITDNINKVKEMHKYAFENCECIQKKCNHINYGDIFYEYIGCVKPDFKKGIGLFKPFFGRIIVGIMGYKLCFCDAVNRVTIKRGFRDAQFMPYMFVKEYDFRNFIFTDGTCMTDRITELKTKYNFSDKYVELMRNNCKQAIVGVDYGKIDDRNLKMDACKWINVWNQMISGLSAKL